MEKIFYTDGINKFGPFSKEELKAEKITSETKVWFFGLSDWTCINQVEELNEITKAIAPSAIHGQSFNKYHLENTKNLKIQYNLKPKSYKKLTLFFAVFLLIIIMPISLFLSKHNKEAKLYRQIVNSSYSSDEDFMIYVDKFYRDVEFHGIFAVRPSTIIIKFAKLEQMIETTHIHGVSFGMNDDSKIEIYINPSSWNNFNKAQRYFLMYHELAHDVLNVNDLKKSEISEGKLMNPNISTYENITMDDFIESAHGLFEQISNELYK